MTTGKKYWLCKVDEVEGHNTEVSFDCSYVVCGCISLIQPDSPAARGLSIGSTYPKCTKQTSFSSLNTCVPSKNPSWRADSKSEDILK